MADTDFNVINHLLEVEKKASNMTIEATSESEKRLSQYRTQADEEYKKQHDAILLNFEKEYSSKIEQINKEHDKAICEYKTHIENAKRDTKAFYSLLDSLLEIK